MKIIKIIFIICVITSGSCKKPISYVKYTDIEFRDSLVLLENKKFTGIIVDSLGYEVAFFEIVDGVSDTIAKSYFYTGELSTVLPMKNFTVVDGIIRHYHKNGKIERVSNVSNNLRSGKGYSFYQNGKPEFIENYVNDTLQGFSQYFDSTGKEVRMGYNKNGEEDSVWLIANMIGAAKTHYIYYIKGFPAFDITRYIDDNQIVDTIFTKKTNFGKDIVELVIEVSNGKFKRLK